MREKYKNLKINSEMINYILSNHNLSNVKIIYDTKYNGGSFSTDRPFSEACDCDFVNGYPHFQVDKDIVVNEINNFINDKPLYNSDIVLRYGDTHPNKPIPNLAQTRNLYVNEVLRNLITTTQDFKNLFLIGDISIKNIRYVCDLLNKTSADEFFKAILNNNTIDDQEFCALFDKNNEIAINNISTLLNKLSLSIPTYVLESDLYKNQKLYDYVRNGITCEDGLKKNGEIKYSLQELMYALSFNSENKTFISLIGSDQSEHIGNVYKIIEDNKLDLDYNFVSYGICKNGMERDPDKWIEFLLNQLSLNFKNINITAESFLRLLYCGSSNKKELDFCNLVNFNNILKKYTNISKALITENNNSGKANTDLLNKMSLVNYYIDMAIRNGEQHMFFDYLNSISVDFLRNNNLSNSDYELFHEFLIKCIDKLNLNSIECEKVVKCKKRS